MKESVQIALLAINTAGLLLILLELSGKTKKTRSGVILDSCALIDGRVEEVIRSGFLDGDIIVPSFVLRELQMLADGGDTHKRARARHGLEIAEQLKKNYADRFYIDESVKSVDKQTNN